LRPEAGLERFGLEIGGDQGEGVVMIAGPRRCARAVIETDAHEALAADIVRGILAHLALGKSAHRGRDAVSDPMGDTGWARAPQGQ
jgi:hypothetical protein